MTEDEFNAELKDITDGAIRLTSSSEVQLEGHFTAADLRKIADTLDKVNAHFPANI